MSISTIATDIEHQVAADTRKTTQYLMPQRLNAEELDFGAYNIYPTCLLKSGVINHGYDTLAAWIAQHKAVVIDGYVGVFWDNIKAELQQHFEQKGLKVSWIDTADYLKDPARIDELIEPFMGTYESVWGRRCTLALADFYNIESLEKQVPDQQTDITIVLGPGAVLAGWNAPLLYIDLPKNELQFRMRAGSITNLGSDKVAEPFYMYKRFYFVDWVLLNQHKKEILQDVAVMIDGQWPDNINWITGDALRQGLQQLSHSPLRVRPWFEPGAWGGQWIKSHINGVNPDAVNYAWSFELIVPENGLVFESDGWLLEVSFDTLMFTHSGDVLGKHAEVYGDEFPIRFDFLDTVKGGNLSIQCHPSLLYIQEQFGENITQDETYYILDCEPNAQVYLGFQDSINPQQFKDALENSQAENQPIDIENYVQAHTATKHDLFLIPNQTIHSAGAGNLVLEISATPYIFTFKMYDWVRLDLEGNPRPINIDHAFKNLDFQRKGERVKQEFISMQTIISQNDGATVVHVPTHEQHFYDVHRLEFDKQMEVDCEGKCHVLMVVEGDAVTVTTVAGVQQNFAYAETFVIPAACGSYTLVSTNQKPVKVIKAFLK
ncbi:class I mannose-6-phosphate isomerase [Mucilaginibacter sp. CSA2-8R]|uniref:class I mannose-6-phosphate isomerase n=1 Tax=Mucilaginibacter sp. CSA2-8R TaxID=3141542 RepID=UPI00315D783A